jgi:cytidylate kinase
MDYRIKQVCQRHGCTRAEARKLISKGESERSNYYNYYTGKKWGDSRSYDLCVNSSLLGIEGTARLVSGFVREVISARKEQMANK